MFHHPPHAPRRDWRGRAITALLVFALLFHLGTRHTLDRRLREPKADTLVVYVFSNTDPEYYANLLFFLRFGVAEGDGCDYVIIIQTGDELPVRPCGCGWGGGRIRLAGMRPHTRRHARS